MTAISVYDLQRMAGWYRKADWNVPVDGRDWVRTAAEALQSIPLNPQFTTSYLGRPDLPEVFVLVRPDGSRYLVDRQGYDYCRYVVRLA